MGSTVVRFLSIATLFTICLLLCNANLSAPCKQNERQALLMFKHDLEDPSNRLSSWVGKGDCCNWTGVVCDNLTVHVRELHLAGHVDMLSGKINQSLLNLKHLTYLDLSNNDFQGMQIPSFLGSLKSLRYLNLSHSWFVGLIPHQLGNLTSLQVLDLGNPPYSEIYSLLEVESLQWISGLSQLQHLDMSGANLSKASDWLRVTNTLPSLVENLDMSFCGLYHIPGGIANMTNLKFLNLGYNSISSTIPKWLYRLSHLQSLSLSYNSFHGEISSSLGNLTSIVNLDLSFNQVAGNIPNSLGNLCKLTTLDMSENNLNGSVSEIFERFSRCSSVQIESLSLSWNNLSGHLTDKLDHFEKLRLLDLANNSISGPLPPSFGNLSCLEVVTIDDNNFTGVVSQLHFTNLTKLVRFEASGNSLTLETTPHWLPPFQLKILVLNSWHLEPSELPMWLQSQTQLQLLSMSNTRISGTIMTWFWNFSSQLTYIDLSENKFYGSLPLVSSTVDTLDLSNSSFSGTLFHFFCNNNSEPKALFALHLGNNLLSGKIPDCFRNWKNLVHLNLESNNLIGNIPRSLGYLIFLEYLHLRNNHLHGELPPYLKKCTELTILDLSYNKFLGKIPMWIGTSLSNLAVLSLRSNQFHGHIPYKLCNLTYLQILDLAHNNLSGRMPRCLYNFTAMTTPDDTRLGFDPVIYGVGQRENANVVTKGRVVKYGNILLSLVISLDLSDNIISGEIPEELTSLIYLQSVNLSYNLLSGRIPPKIGDMRRLESLDLSMNQLCGQIAPSMSSLTFLSALNLSYNNLTGEIPKSTQLQSLDQSSFIGNKLCGPPLEVNCSNTNGTVPSVADQKHGGSDLLEDGWFYLSLGLGFLFGFWSVLGSLLLNLPWSIVFSRFQNSIVKKLYGVIVEYF
ncbi:hypothetical protein PRUPE_1G575200 [Prunus persica]|uniref:Leucine-rich repeat-containing N-terminal plant-type domain-containing protein n=2 Tax=Prunus persica TaxID=3760 RepID=A0A251RKA7_PRUPE|nr:hypothetical protein PRUPE_1G575200 [Prunus persica]